MSAQIIDGKAIAATIRAEVKAEVEELKAQTGQVPGDHACILHGNQATV